MNNTTNQNDLTIENAGVHSQAVIN